MALLKPKTGAGSVPSMQNVAAYAGVSIATVSKVMQGDATVRPDNVTAVQNAIEALGYRINPLAAELRRGRRKLIGVVVPSFDDLTMALVDALETHAAERGYALWAAASDRSVLREGEIIGRFQDWRVAGLIVVPVSSGNGSSALLVNETTPAVFVECADVPDCDTVSTDLESAARAILEQLSRLGHERIAIVSSANDVFAPRLKDAYTAIGVSPPALKLLWLDLSAAPRKGADEIRSLLDGAEHPTAVVAIGSQVATMVGAYAAGRQWNIPLDLSLVTLVDSDVAHADVALSSLCYPARAVAERAVNAILRRIEQPNATVSRQTEPCGLQVGSTMGHPAPSQTLRTVRRQ